MEMKPEILLTIAFVCFLIWIFFIAIGNLAHVI